MSTTIVIPARLASTRLAQKMLLNKTGMPLLQHTYLKAKQSKLANRVVIATDDQGIFDIAQGFNAEVMMTSPDHPTGTDRLAELAQRELSDQKCIINLQGDEPECVPGDIDQLIQLFLAGHADMATIACKFPEQPTEGPQSPMDPNNVKVVLGKSIGLGFEALYFSRNLIPYPRDSHGKIEKASDYYMHIGLYAFSPRLLQQFSNMPQSKLEKSERLEQLRLLENGYRISVGLVDKAKPGIDTQADYDAFVKRWQHQTEEVVA